MVMLGEVDHQRWDRQRRQLPGGHRSMVTVGHHPPGERETGKDQNRGKSAANGPETGVAFPHIVKEGRHHHLLVASTFARGQGCLVSVSLVGVVLSEEQTNGLWGQPLCDEVALGRRQSP